MEDLKFRYKLAKVVIWSLLLWVCMYGILNVISSPSIENALFLLAASILLMIYSVTIHKDGFYRNLLRKVWGLPKWKI